MEALLAGLLEHIVPILISIIGAVLLKLAHGATKKFGAKLDVETQGRAEALLQDLIQQGVTYAEQASKNAAKHHGGALHGSQKLDKAMEYIAEELERNGLPQLAERTLTNKIESALGFGTLNENHSELTVVGEAITEDEDDDEDGPEFPTGA